MLFGSKKHPPWDSDFLNHHSWQSNHFDWYFLKATWIRKWVLRLSSKQVQS